MSMEREEDLIQENRRLQRKIKLLEEALQQERSVHAKYNEAIQKIKEKDKALLELNRTLEMKVQERTVELTAAIDKLAHLASTDSLTQINNRMRFNILLSQKIAETSRSKDGIGLVLFDIDRFKDVNDTFGHQAGDRVLTELAALIKNHIRKSDIFARWGGEEFALILDDCHLSCIRDMAEELRMVVENHDFNLDHFTLTCSYGVTLLKTSDTTNSAIERVDKALYVAKQRGRNRVVTRL